MNSLEKAGLTASVDHIERFSKSGVPIYNSEVPDTAGRKMRRRTTTTKAIVNVAPAELVLSQLSSRSGRNFSCNNISDRVTN